MHNKLIILTLLTAFAFSASAQQSVEQKDDPFSDVIQENKIQIYPNPAVEHLTVQISNSDFENVQFELHSIIGNKMTVRVQDLGSGKYKIPVDGFATGYYFLIITDEKARFKKAYKFLKD